MGRPRGSKNTKWFQVEQDYTSGITQPDGSLHFPTLEELSVTYGIKISTLTNRSSRDGWVDKRVVFKDNLRQNIEQKKQRDYFEDAIKIERTSLQIVKGLQRAVIQNLMVKVVTTDQNGQTREEYVPNEKLKPLHIKQLAEASNLCVDMKDKIMGGKQAEDDTAMRAFCKSVDSLIRNVREQGLESETEP